MRSPLFVALVVLVGCAHAEGGGPGTAALLASDHSYLSGDTYGSDTDDSSLPEDRADRLARLYEDEEPETVVEGPIVLWTGQEPEAIAMSRDLPAGSIVRITRLDDGRSIIVEVRRREPLPYGLLALSDEAARHLGLEERTELQARVEVLSRPEIASR